MINIGISMINLLGISMINIGISMINFGISMISILMIDMSKNLAGWISSWVENDLGGFRLGGKWLKVWVDFGGWKTAGGKRLGGFWMGGFRLQGILCHLFVYCSLHYFFFFTRLHTYSIHTPK